MHMSSRESDAMQVDSAEPEAYKLLEEDPEAEAGPSFALPSTTEIVTLPSTAPPKSCYKNGPPPHMLGGDVAYQVMRDALALQLARRGFDGLRQSALWLSTELAADFIQALGTQLAREPGPPASSLAAGRRPTASQLAPLALRLQRATNLRSPAEWRQLQASFVRVAEPAAGPTGGRPSAEAKGPPRPPSVAPMYAAMKSAWYYKQTGSGRTAHHAAGASEVPTPSSHPNTSSAIPAELAQSLRLGKRQRQLAESWLQGTTPQQVQLPVLLPGPLLEPIVPASGAPVVAAGGGKGGKGRAKKAGA